MGKILGLARFMPRFFCFFALLNQSSLMPFMRTEFPGLLIFEPQVFGDSRGYFFESYHEQRFAEAGVPLPFVQDNQARSGKGVLRGLHFQTGEFAQAKLVRVVEGSVYDFVVDLRQGSPTYGRGFGLELSAENKKQLYVPRGFAHGYLVLSEFAEFFYKCDNYYAPQHEGGLRYDDPAFEAAWPLEAGQTPLVSDKDRRLPLLADMPNPGFVWR